MSWFSVVGAAVGGGLGGLAGGVLAAAFRSEKSKRTMAAVGSVVGLLLSQHVTAPMAERWDFERQLRAQAPAAWTERTKDIFVEEVGDLLRSDAFKTWARAHPEAGQAAGADLSSRGMARLTDEDMERLRRLKRRLAEKSPALCEAFWTGQAQISMVHQALQEHLSESEVRDWLRINTLATKLELEDRVPARKVKQDDVGTVLLTLAGTMEAAQRDRFINTLQQGESARGQDACKAFLIMADASDVLKPADRSTLARFIVAPMAVE